MKRIVESCLFGKYDAASDDEIDAADAIVAQSFGTRENGPHPFGYVNELLGRKALKLSVLYGLPIFAQEEIADSIGMADVEMRIAGDPSSASGAGLDSWGVLRAAKERLTEDNPSIVLVAQSHHAVRVAAQAEKQGMTAFLPEGLPSEFAPDSEQLWTRSRGLWVMRELPGLGALKLQSKL